MVEKIFENIKVMLTKSPYSIKSKISGYIHDDKVDRSKMKIWLLPETKITFCVDIKHYTDGGILYGVELDGKSSLEVDDINLDKLYEVINNFNKKCNANFILMDSNYNIFAYAFDKDTYLPNIDYENINKLELSIMTVAPMMDDITKDKDNYIIIVIGDLIKTVDYYTIHNLIFILIKTYVENRFTVINQDRMKDSRIISYQGFAFLFYHIKGLLHTKETYKETIKTGYDTMSKINMLPKVPSNNWYIEEYAKGLKIDRLKQFNKKKQTIFERIVKGREKEEVAHKTPFIPTYYSHYFDKDSPVISWKDFVETFQNFDFESLLPRNNYIAALSKDEYYITPVVIIPDEDIVDLTPEDICFMGYDGEYLYIVINSKEITKRETIEETKLKEKISRNLHIKYGLTSDITFDTYKISQQRLDLLEE